MKVFEQVAPQLNFVGTYANNYRGTVSGPVSETFRSRLEAT
jgi:hypothetical protein